MKDFFIPRQEYSDVKIYVAFDEYDYIYYVDACPRCNFSILEYLIFNKVVNYMNYVGQIDFVNGDFELRHFDANTMEDAMSMQFKYVKEHYGERIDDVIHVAVNDLRYIRRLMDNY